MGVSAFDSGSLVLAALPVPAGVSCGPSVRPAVLSPASQLSGLALVGAGRGGFSAAALALLARRLVAAGRREPGAEQPALVVGGPGLHPHLPDLLAAAGGGERTIDLSSPDRWSWNPLHAPWLDSYSLASMIVRIGVDAGCLRASQPWPALFTQTLARVVHAHRAAADPWFTFRDLHRVLVSSDAVADLIAVMTRRVYDRYRFRVSLDETQFVLHERRLSPLTFTRAEAEACRRAASRGVSEKFTPPVELLRPGAGSAVVPVAWALSCGQRHALLSDLAYRAFGWEACKSPQIFFCAEQSSVPTDGESASLEGLRDWYLHEWKLLDARVSDQVCRRLSLFLRTLATAAAPFDLCPPDPRRLSVVDRARLVPSLTHVVASGRVVAFVPGVGVPRGVRRLVGALLAEQWLSAVPLVSSRWDSDAPSPAGVQRGRARSSTFVCEDYPDALACSGGLPSLAAAARAGCRPVVSAVSAAGLDALSADCAGQARFSFGSRLFVRPATARDARAATRWLARASRRQALLAPADLLRLRPADAVGALLRSPCCATPLRIDLESDVLLSEPSLSSAAVGGLD